MQFVIEPRAGTTLSLVTRAGAGMYKAGVLISAHQGGCGLGWMQGFYGQPSFQNWQDEAEWVAALYRHLYGPGHVLYCLTDGQLNNAAHKTLLNIGSRQIDGFPNLYHGPAMQSVFHVNIRDACGRYCDKYGDAYQEPPKDESEVIVSPTAAQDGAFQSLPIRPKK